MENYEQFPLGKVAVRVLSAVIALYLFIVGQAQAVAPARPPLYEVEILVFENRLPELEGGELWLGEPRITSELFREAVAMGVSPAPDSVLSRAAALLEKDGHYRILAHQRWRQTAEPKSVTKPVKVISSDPALNGALKLYLSRFLHVNLELVLHADSGQSSDTPAQQTYWINEHRRIRTKTLHYFDHPKFGALVSVVQIDKE